MDHHLEFGGLGPEGRSRRIASWAVGDDAARFGKLEHADVAVRERPARS